MDMPIRPKSGDGTGCSSEGGVPMGAVPIPPDCAAKAFPYLVAAGNVPHRPGALGDSKEEFLGAGEGPEEEPIDWEPHPDEDDVPKGVRNKQLGAKGEEAACRFLHRHGYVILERNWSCVAGEADIICLGDSSLVFVEVKTRRSEAKGFPSEAVSRKKRQRYERIALCYLKESDLVDIDVRFDVVSVIALGHSRAFIRHDIGAFQTP